MTVLNKLYRFSIIGVILLAILSLTGTNVSALTSGETYTVSIEKVNSDGSLSDTGASATATADGDGKIAFSLSGIPGQSAVRFHCFDEISRSGRQASVAS